MIELELEKAYKSFEEGVEFVFGVVSPCDASNTTTANLWSANDLSIIRHTDTGEYSIELNGLVGFPKKDEYAPKHYIGGLMEKFRNWMIESGLDVDYPVDTYELFISGASVETRYESIEELYSSVNKLATVLVTQEGNTPDNIKE